MSLIRRMDFEGSVAVLCRCHVMVCQIPKVGMYSRNKPKHFVSPRWGTRVPRDFGVYPPRLTLNPMSIIPPACLPAQGSILSLGPLSAEVHEAKQPDGRPDDPAGRRTTRRRKGQC